MAEARGFTGILVIFVNSRKIIYNKNKMAEKEEQR
jgi:hypothetical protein